jgi:hypothetical protein
MRYRTERTPARPRPSATVALGLFVLCLNGCALLGRTATIAYLDVDAAFSEKEIDISINKTFVEQYKDRVTITADFTVDKAMVKPVANEFDGDLHMAGRSPQIDLPTVAEISNAASEHAAVDTAHAVEGTGRSIRLVGVWRLWPEHAGAATEKQGKAIGPLSSDDPSHVFEIHPIITISGLDVRDSFKPVPGFLPGDAHATLGAYEKAACRLTVKPKSITIRTTKGLYNDVEFLLEVAPDRQTITSDGRFVYAAALDLKGDTVVPRLRMVFARGTPPEIAVRALKPGDRLHVYGMARVSLAEVSRRVRGASADSTLLVGHLPYEIIILGVFDANP